MADEDLKLVEPSLEYREDFLAMAGEYLETGTAWEKTKFQEAFKDFPAYVRKLLGNARGEARPDGYVPASTYWLMRDGKTIVATSNLRHKLTPHLEREGGHIGYGTCPSQRGKGYGTAICALTLHKAREMGLKRVLITCDIDNPASTRIIEKNGGKFEDQVVSKETGKLKNRYWVDLQGS